MVQHLLYEIYLLPFAACVDLSWLPFCCFVVVITSFVVVITRFIERWWYFYEIVIFWRK
jgi:Na+-transporting NADH:ubiquinone oxidoreductase subunit NqrE